LSRQPAPTGAPADANSLKIEGEIARDFTALAAPPRVGDVVDVAATTTPAPATAT
jgi:hypothetical protein